MNRKQAMQEIVKDELLKHFNEAKEDESSILPGGLVWLESQVDYIARCIVDRL